MRASFAVPVAKHMHPKAPMRDVYLCPPHKKEYLVRRLLVMSVQLMSQHQALIDQHAQTKHNTKTVVENGGRSRSRMVSEW